MNNSRALLIILLLFVVLVVLLGRLFTIQITQHEKYAKIAKRQQNKTIKINAERGLIKDRNGELLAYTKDDVSLFVDTRMTNKKEKEKIAKRFAAQFGKSKKYYLKKLNRAKKNICLEKKASKEDVLNLSDFIASGYFQVEDYSRVYPYGSLASHVLGYVDRKLIGTNGIEKKFNENLTGINGYKYIERDAQGRIVTVNQKFSAKPTTGNNIELTIDKNLQKILEEELQSGLKKFRGESAIGIIMNPQTGEVLALSNQPDYDPANYNVFSNLARRNRALTDTYEPGSTMKPLVMSMLLEEKLTYESEVTNTENGRYKVRGATITDSHDYDKLTSTEIISHSSNVGIAKLSDRIDDNLFFKYLRDYGFGNLTSIDLPGETRGMLKKPKRYSKISKNFISFGYEISVTPIQLITAYCALINGGNLYRPYVVKAIRDTKGNYIDEFTSKKIRKVISKETSKRVIEMMKETVSNGTGIEANLPNVAVGGKTGTAQILIDRKYSNSKYNSSFVGFFPADNPKYVSLILVKSPSIGKYGGRVAAPIFKKIAERIVDSDKSIIIRKKNEIIIDDKKYAVNEKETDVFVTSNLAASDNRTNSKRDIKYSGNSSAMPNLYSFTKRDAIKILNDLNVKYKIIGSGNVVWQSVQPGSKLKNISLCKIKCQLAKTNSRIRIH
jgi:cell division protein FtsI/penicillin-binding protein 2